ncbi:Uncharacterised protein [Corynebacterium jeikeium]|uniref:Transcriptional regulator, AbiEi antitoxin, Type IV TA system n=1 Tax=Corynebacterium jeikeium (strain K411) TaxID=306537 RepID=Q4JSI4_CORJK|nr:hypothetical protein [Corynebacterium jeikeium]CAI38223.1 hypothetical protein jk2041 [Corynebacterium jeikeium K411]SUY84425.1 Uncharacterised protein [Corynebacterium jeikeium]
MTGDNTNASISKPTTSRNTKPTKPTATKPNTTKPSAYTPAKHHQPVKHLVDVRRIDPSQARKWQRWVEKGEAVRLARGIYIPAGLWREIGQQPNAAEIQAQAFIVAEYLRYSHRIPAVVAGKSAAFLHGLPLEKFEPPETVELASPKRSLMGRNGRSERYLAAPGQGQRAVLIPTEFGEIWTSGLLDTCHDLGLRHSLDDAVIATEAALHTKKITWHEWRKWLDRQGGQPIRHGAKRARTAARLITRFSESPRESQLKIRFWEHGLPAPFQQVNILNEGGWPIGRVDMFFDVGLAVEYDGREKYGSTTPAIERALLKERQRENDIQARGITLLRVTAETYLSGRAVEQVSEHFHTLAARPTRPPCTLWSGGTLAWS